MSESAVDVLIVGGGCGGFAAALAASSMGVSVILTEETDWIGGQLTAQAVPPDEHPWIEQFGCTRSYREFRNRVRALYRQLPLTPEAAANVQLNPGGGWVSKLCAEPSIAYLGLLQMFAEAKGIQLRTRLKPMAADTEGDVIRSVTFRNLETGDVETIAAGFVLDATELGDLLAMANVEYVLGAESKSETGEPNALEGPAEPHNVQGLTWVYALGWDPAQTGLIEKPAQYEKWRAWTAPNWPGSLLSFEVFHAHTGVLKTLPLFNPGDWYELFSYRQIVSPNHFAVPREAATIVNWPQNDYFEASILDVEAAPEWDHPTPGASGPLSASRLEDSRQLGLSLLYWLQNEAPRHDSGYGYPELKLRPDLTGTVDGFAKYPYIRESRRIQALHTIREQDVAAYENPGLDRAPDVQNSVGIGAYRIDLHPSTSGAKTIDTSTLPFQIPLGSLVPIRVRNLLPACKNLGVTHITNGCYRLHPVEWNIGESAGALAAFCFLRGLTPQQVSANDDLAREFRGELEARGVELAWPEGEMLRAL